LYDQATDSKQIETKIETKSENIFSHNFLDLTYLYSAPYGSHNKNYFWEGVMEFYLTLLDFSNFLICTIISALSQPPKPSPARPQTSHATNGSTTIDHKRPQAAAAACNAFTSRQSSNLKIRIRPLYVSGREAPL
jgi:hypothetical protein